jgi:hypothetical protein
MSRSPKLQRLTAMAVPALLAANAMVLVLGLSLVDDGKPANAETVTYIQAADGTMRMVDPTTPEGWKAIADANERGETVVTVPHGGEPAEVMQQSATTTAPTVPATLPVDELLDETESTVVDTLDKVGDTVDGIVDDLTDKIDDKAGTDIGKTVDPTVDKVTDTLTTTVSTVVRTVTTTAPTVPPQVTVPPPIDEVVPLEVPDVPLVTPGL